MGSDRITEGVYLRVTGGPPLLAWASGEPEGEAEDCMQVLVAGAVGDRDCTESNDYICEYDGIAVDPSTY